MKTLTVPVVNVAECEKCEECAGMGVMWQCDNVVMRQQCTNVGDVPRLMAACPIGRRTTVCSDKRMSYFLYTSTMQV